MSSPSLELDYITFFKDATRTQQGTAGNHPYDYQTRLATAPCESRLITIPTGLGKTAAVVLAWLWNRVHKQDQDPNTTWPRRLVFCLPMRTLVEQTKDCCQQWLQSSGHENEIGLHILMGGEDADDWDIHPEKPAILIGTQDMLLSRALNRGYGMSRHRWPMHFGLLNNDALWILDETQLMGVGVSTSAQLEGLRTKIGTALACKTWWASATLDKRLLATPDHREQSPIHKLEDADLADEAVKARIHAVKKLSPLPLSLSADSAKIKDPYLDKLADSVVEKHQPGTLTIVIVNRVDRAKALYERLDQLSKKKSLPKLALIHSRFRPMERNKQSENLYGNEEQVLIATQAIEAGVNISARTLITELAPWSSLVQRFGRCNRKGEYNASGGANIYWVNLESADAKDASAVSLPYTPESLHTARTLLKQIETSGASPSQLEKVHAEEPLPDVHILRRKDLVELFDTTPDLSGLDIDVGRYIRDGEDRDVQVFWRDIEKDQSPDETIKPTRDELVRVSVTDFEKFLKKNKDRIWNWNALDGEWQLSRADRIAPGQVYLVDHQVGGYSKTLGWTGEKSKTDFDVLQKDIVSTIEAPRDGQSVDDESQIVSGYESLEEHTEKVVKACEDITNKLNLPISWKNNLVTAAWWHDLGKSHPCFQAFITKGRNIPPEYQNRYIAKAPISEQRHRHERPFFRHELASALAWLKVGHENDLLTQSLIAYIIVSHHGKVRLSIKSMPGEVPPPPKETSEEAIDTSPVLFARGIWNGEELLSDSTKNFSMANIPAGPLSLDLGCMQMGEYQNQPSWVDCCLLLRDSAQIGLFRLAYLETVFRAADAIASKSENPIGLHEPAGS